MQDSAELPAPSSKKWLSSYVDRYGKTRWKFRRKSVCLTIPGQPGQPEFDSAYQKALSGHLFEEAKRIRVSHKIRFLRSISEATLKRAKTRATRQRVPFALDYQTLELVMMRQNWKCAVSGKVFWDRLKRHEDEERPFRPSLDRIEPRLGYVEGNVRFVCEIANLAMNSWGEEPLKRLAEMMRWHPRP